MKKIIVLITVLLLLNACSTAKMNTASMVKSDYGFLKLIGNGADKEVILNDKIIVMNPQKSINSFELKSGIYNLEIKKDGKLIYSQKVFINPEQTNEVQIP
jgi:uncharacterized protein YcfL